MKDERKKRITRISLFPYIIIYIYMYHYIFINIIHIYYISICKEQKHNDKNTTTLGLSFREKSFK